MRGCGVVMSSVAGVDERIQLTTTSVENRDVFSFLSIACADYRNKLKWLEAAQKNSNSNPRRGGPWHWRAPSRIFWKTVRGMIPHKTQRGAEAMARLKVRTYLPFPQFAAASLQRRQQQRQSARLRPGLGFEQPSSPSLFPATNNARKRNACDPLAPPRSTRPHTKSKQRANERASTTEAAVTAVSERARERDRKGKEEA